jgi:uncharacterized membrane protein
VLLYSRPYHPAEEVAAVTILILGLVLFLGVHSTRIVADDWRAARVARWGPNAWKAVYSLVALVGLLLIIWGYGLARQQPVVLWTPPRGMNHLASLLMVFSLVLLVATYVPRNAIRARLRHPMVLAVKVWALGHLLSNGTLADVLLFGGFLAWAVMDFRSARQRDRRDGVQALPSSAAGTLTAVVLGVALWAALAFGGHAWLFGVAPLAR